MKITHRSLCLVSSVFAITLSSMNPVEACGWFSSCCGYEDDENNSQRKRLIPSDQTMGEGYSSLADQNIDEQAQRLSWNTYLSMEDGIQQQLEQRKAALAEDKKKTEQEERAIKELEDKRAARKQEETRIGEQEEALRKKNKELRRRKKAALNTPVKGSHPSMLPEKLEELQSSTSTPTEFLSSYQQELVNSVLREKISPTIWEHLEGNKQKLAEALVETIKSLPEDLLKPEKGIIDISFISSKYFKLKVGNTHIKIYNEY